MSKVEMYNDKIIRHEAGWGYRITEGDVGEIVISDFRENSSGIVWEEKLRVCSGAVAECLGKALIEKSREMEVGYPKSGQEGNIAVEKID